MKKILAAMVLALGAMFGAFEAGAALAGNGTKTDPYRIGSYDDLVAFAAKVNGGETNACAVLTADITATGTTWTPIGDCPIDSWDKFYVGTFDGQGYKISNLSNASVSPSPDNAGLFGFVGPNGIVRNVNLVNVNISAAEGEGTASGGVVGCNAGGAIKNCSVSGVVRVGCYSGGIAGYNAQGMVEGCCNIGNVTGICVGGIVSANYIGTVENSYNTGNVSGKYAGGGIVCVSCGDHVVGGGVVKNCYNTGAVEATDPDDGVAGGVVGQNGEGGSVENCYNTGSVTGIHVGGVAGINDSDSVAKAELFHCYALDSVASGVVIWRNEGGTEVVDVRALSAAEFRVQSNFTGWDFKKVWKMGENAPKLRTGYDVTYDENWAGGAKTKKELDAGDGILANAPADPKREGWYFCGWFTESEGGVKVTGETVADGDATYYAQWGKPAATFASAAVSSSESKTVKLTVYGGSLTGPSSVKVFMTYQTAAAADLDLANATINGEPVKGGLKFPLTLAWDTGDMNPVTIEIPVKADKSVEDGETFTFQIADVIGTEMDETLECTVTLDDPGYAELRGKIEEGTATKAESNTWTKASHEGIPYMRGLAYPADGGKVTGSAYCPENKKVALKATANKGWKFLGWRQETGNGEWGTGNGFVATTASLVIDRTAKPAKDTKTSTTLTGIAESTTFYAVFEGDPRVTATPVAFDETKGLFVASEGGKITGAGRYAPGKKVTLKATANKGFVFGGWYGVNGKLRMENGKLVEGEGGSPSSATEAAPLSREASFSFEMGEEDVDLYARFVTAGEDAGSIVATFNGAVMSSPPDGSPAITTNVWAGVYLEWPLASEALSQTTIKVSGLPSGLKFTAKPVTSKVGSGKTAVTVTNVPANTIYGAPTAASKTDKNTGAAKPSAVKVTVTTAGKSTQTYQIDTVVDALPTWAQGTFAGGMTDGGQVSLTVSAAGKTSGKALGDGLTYTLAAPYYTGFEMTDGVSNFLADVTATWSYKEGTKTIKTNEVVKLVVQDNGVGGYAAADDWFEAYTVNWKVEPWKTLGKSFDKKTLTYAIREDGEFIDGDEAATVALSEEVTGRVTLKFSASGAVSVAGEFVAGYNDKTGKYTIVKATGSATLVPVGDGRFAVFVHLAPKGLPPHARCIEAPWPEG